MRNTTHTVGYTLPKVHVYTLGSFSMHIGNHVIDDTLNRSRKTWNLIAYLIMFRDRYIGQTELIDMLWPEETSDNPISALKTLISRCRVMLEPFMVEDSQLLISQRGSYAWNKASECSVDAEDFENICRQAGDTSLNPEVRLKLYRQAIHLYKGDFLTKLSDQLWVVQLSAHYQALYLNTVKAFARLLENKQCFAEMTEVCNRAIQIDPYDEQLHTLLVLALYLQGKSKAALNHYEAATDLLYRNLGISPSKELRAIYSQIMKEHKFLETDLNVIQENLKEECQEGAFICDYGFFKEAYRLEARRGIRQGTCAHIGLITVTTESGTVPSLVKLNKAMGLLQSTLRGCLRKGDVASRYSGAQYIILLANANYEDSIMVLERIIKTFYHQNRYTQLTLHYKLRQIELAEL